MNVIREVLSEQGSISCMRVLSCVSLLVGSGIAIYGITHSKDLSGVTMLVSVFVGSAFGGKILQKKDEK